MSTIRVATEVDVDFLTRVDLLDEGVTPHPQSPSNFEEHRVRMQSFVNERAAAAWVVEVSELGPVGVIMCRFRDLENEVPIEANTFLLRYIPRSTFPADGRFTEIYQLWVSPPFRRRGYARRLKIQVEAESKHRGITQLYTHTEERHEHVVRMNLNLGYRELRRGPMWDEVIRVSLVKNLGIGRQS